MDGIVTLLNQQQNEFIEGIWRTLRQECGLREITVTPIPHFSWSVADRFDLPATEAVLREVSARAPSFTVSTGGLGLFLTPEPVLFLSVVKNRSLLEFHESLWEATRPFAVDLNPRYAPEEWTPHITLAQRDLSPESIPCAINRLYLLDLDLRIAVDTLAIICQHDGGVGELRSSFSFGG